MPNLPLDQSLLRMLVLSVSLHLAVLMIVQPTRVQERMVSPPITARLQAAEPAPVPVQEEVVSPGRENALHAAPHESLPVPRQVRDAPEQTPLATFEAAGARPSETSPPTPGSLRPTEVAMRADAGPASPAEPVPDRLPSVPIMTDTTWYEIRQLDMQPRVLQPVHPAYPTQARRQGLEGTVKLMLKIDEYGVVQEAAVEAGEPPGVFDAAALAAFRAVRFAPAQKNQRPVRALVYVRVVFRLE